MTVPHDPAMQHPLHRMTDDLCAEFAGQFARAQIEDVLADSVERVLATATVFDFVPTGSSPARSPTRFCARPM